MRRCLQVALLVLAASAALPGVGAGCGSADCTETATCSGELGDASAADHTSTTTNDGSGPTGDDAAGSGDTGNADDAGTAVDATDAGGSGNPADGGDAGDAGNPGDAADASNAADGGCNPSAPDCSNPECQVAFMCTTAAPAGWSGPVALFDQGGGPPAPTAAACPGNDDDVFDGNSSPTSPLATCGCTCGSAQGVCSNPAITIYPDNQCVAANHCGSAGPTTCTVANGSSCSGGGQSAQVASLPQPTGSGSCGAGATQNGLPASGWARTGRGCAASRTLARGGCAAQQVCADKPPPSFTPTLCVWQNADTNCAGAAGYPSMYKYYSGVLDSRGCALGSCTCGSPTGVSCSLAGVTSYTAPDCSDGGTALPDLTVGYCNVVGNLQIWGMKTSVASAAQCLPSGTPANTGTVAPDPSTAVTVCCAN